MHHPVAIANYFINQSKDGLSLMQLLKLSYVAHGFCLALYDRALSRELPQAWQYGPVFASMYHAFKYLGPDKITKHWQDELDDLLIDEDHLESDFNENEKDMMNRVLEQYGSFSGWQLSALTHAKDTPWYYFYNESESPGKKYHGVSITNERIKNHFLSKIEKVKNGNHKDRVS